MEKKIVEKVKAEVVMDPPVTPLIPMDITCTKTVTSYDEQGKMEYIKAIRADKSVIMIKDPERYHPKTEHMTMKDEEGNGIKITFSSTAREDDDLAVDRYIKECTLCRF